MPEIQIRTAKKEDKEFIVSLVSRLTEFELPSWREPKQMNVADEEVLSRVLLTNPPEVAILMAEDNNGVPLGFIHLNISTDYYTHEKHGHISDIIVAPNGEGRGVGKALMAAGEEWARNNRFRWLTLNVFTHNTRARKLYEKLGYEEDTIKYLKEL
jgi:ribosomal protein S18 acetylase RimI-like enzyme